MQNDDRIQVYAPKALARRAKLYAVNSDSDVSAVVRQALIEYLDRHEAEAAQAATKE